MILSLDLSLNSAGYCLWDSAPMHVGLISNPVGGEIAPKLLAISQAIQLMITQHNPSCIALEDVYVGPNAKTIIALAKVHGAVLLTAAQANISVIYIPGPTIKKALGAKGKLGVFNKICELFPELTNNFTYKNNDVTDALALALTYEMIYAETSKN